MVYCRADVLKDWTYIAMNSTYRALAKAGFSQVNFPKLRDVMFITNPEAAVIYTARYYRDDLAQTTLQVRRKRLEKRLLI